MEATDSSAREDPNFSHAPWMEYAGMVETGGPDSSLTIDEVVYGQVD
jgi:hypothetical protein